MPNTAPWGAIAACSQKCGTGSETRSGAIEELACPADQFLNRHQVSIFSSQCGYLGRSPYDFWSVLSLTGLTVTDMVLLHDREQSFGECRPHHEFRRSRRRRGDDFGGNCEKPPDQPGRGAEAPQAPRARGTGRSSPRPPRRRKSPTPGIRHYTRSDLQGG